MFPLPQSPTLGATYALRIASSSLSFHMYSRGGPTATTRDTASGVVATVGADGDQLPSDENGLASWSTVLLSKRAIHTIVHKGYRDETFRKAL